MKNPSKRLQTIGSYVQPYERVADIGSDHALLPCYMIHQKIASFVVAGEVTDGPFVSAKTQVSMENLASFIQVRRGDGLDVIEDKDKIEVIVIAGMGGKLISEILERGVAKLKHVKRFILQPNNQEMRVRLWLQAHDFFLTQEKIIEEDGRIYEILVAEPHVQGQELNAQLYVHPLSTELGPYLMKEQSETWIKKWNLELEKLERIYQQVPEERKKQVFKNKIEEVRKCLYTEFV